MSWYGRSIFYPFHGSSGEIPLFQVLFVSFLFTPLAGGFGFITLSPPCAKAPGLVPTIIPRKPKLSVLWTHPFKRLAVGSDAAAADGRPVAAKRLYLDLSSDLPGKDSKRRVSVARRKPCLNPHDTDDILRFLPTGLTRYVSSLIYWSLPPIALPWTIFFRPVSRSNRFVVTKLFAAGVALLLFCTILFGMICLFLLWSARWVFNDIVFAFLNIGRVRPTNIVKK